MSTKVEELKGQIASVVQEAKDLKDGAKDGHFNGEQTHKGELILATAARLAKELKHEQGMERMVSDIDALSSGSIMTEQDLARLPAVSLGRSVKSWGEQFTDAPHVAALAKQYENREIPQSLHVQLESVQMSDPAGKAVIISDAGQGALLAPDERGLIDLGPFQRPLVLRNLISNGRTNSLAVRYARMTGWTNAAAGVHEASTATGTGLGGGVKPQSDITTTPYTATVITIAHWFAASKQSVADIPLLRTLIDQYGRYGLSEEEEDQIIAGTGVANDQLDGFRFASGIQTQAYSTSIPDTIRKAITKVQVNAQAQPNGVLMNPADAEAVDLLKDQQLRYYGNGPFGIGPNTLWGLPRVVSQAVPAQKAYVADFRTILFLVREDPSVSITDSHSDYFVRNLIAILFEERATQLIFRPSAIVECTTA